MTTANFDKNSFSSECELSGMIQETSGGTKKRDETNRSRKS